ncbi:MAG: type I-U CRISPR-associated protein Csx17 [Polyangiaceae bacterium]|nr:type I-U CRISPR-associated protein Csx17 [Polyangiaceae bacterium]
MTFHLHRLEGCAPAPLAHYLKALGVLRVVAQQRDPGARGFWRDQDFWLLTALDEAALEAFFLEEYAPTPFVSPWNKGSGFYKEGDKGLAPIEASRAARFEPFRRGIAAAREPLESMVEADARVRNIKDRAKDKTLSSAEQARLRASAEHKQELAAAEREFKRLKADLFTPLARSFRGPHREWVDAAVVLSAEGPTYPSLLGTGGNDGNLDFTNAAMQRLGELFDLASADGAPAQSALGLLRAALFQRPSPALVGAAVGQFLPGSAGGANATTGPGGGAQINPWDFVLMLEGAVAFRGQATRRLGAQENPRAAIPFAVAAQAVGYATPGQEKDARGEQWMPLWEQAASWSDVSALLGEGRAQLGRASAHRPLDFARAISTLGVARGLTGFVRYGYLERNGQSNLAVPLGRVQVAERSRARLIDDLAGWLDRLRRELGKESTARLRIAVNRLSDAVFDVVTRDAEPERWQGLLLAITAVERVQASGTAFKAGPCPRLSAEWLDAAANACPEWRLAVALGSAAADYRAGRPLDPARAHVLPIDAKRIDRYATGADARLLNDPRVVMNGREPMSDLIALVERRLVEASQRSTRTLPLASPSGAGARFGDLACFLEARIDAERVLALGQALMALDWRRARPSRSSAGGARLDEGWEAVRLCLLPFPVRGQAIAAEPAMVRRLAAGDVTGAVALALRRLRASGLRPPVVAATADPLTARRWAAALAFPIDPAVAEAMADRFENPTARETP